MNKQSFINGDKAIYLQVHNIVPIAVSIVLYIILFVFVVASIGAHKQYIRELAQENAELYSTVATQAAQITTLQEQIVTYQPKQASKAATVTKSLTPVPTKK